MTYGAQLHKISHTLCKRNEIYRLSSNYSRQTLGKKIKWIPPKATLEEPNWFVDSFRGCSIQCWFSHMSTRASSHNVSSCWKNLRSDSGLSLSRFSVSPLFCVRVRCSRAVSCTKKLIRFSECEDMGQQSEQEKKWRQIGIASARLTRSMSMTAAPLSAVHQLFFLFTRLLRCCWASVPRKRNELRSVELNVEHTRERDEETMTIRANRNTRRREWIGNSRSRAGWARKLALGL